MGGHRHDDPSGDSLRDGRSSKSRHHRRSRRRSPSSSASSSTSRSERRHRHHRHRRDEHSSRHSSTRLQRPTAPTDPFEPPVPTFKENIKPPQDLYQQEYGAGAYDPSKACHFGDYDNLFEDVSAVDWRNESLEELIKDFYIEDPLVTRMTDADVEKFRAENMIIVNDARCPKPILSFEMATLPIGLGEQLSRVFPRPTPIQSQALPIALSGFDLIGIAQTGSGKTLGFLLPALVHCKAQPPMQRGQGPIVLIMAPTRELAMQISAEGEKYLTDYGISICTIVGGDANRVFDQRRQLQQAPEIVVACPGRLADHVTRGNINFKRVTYFVLDEADRLLDMGFGRQIKAASALIRPDRQTLMWSATWPVEVKDMAKEIFRDRLPIFLKIGKVGDTSVRTITHTFEYIQNYHDAPDALIRYISDKADKRLLVFTNTKAECNFLMDRINRDSPASLAMVIHGDKTQVERNQAIAKFRDGSVNILIATDVLARGLDFEAVYAVVNYRMPKQKEEWIHRVGRTGRAGIPGRSLSFVTDADWAVFGKIKETLTNTFDNLPESYLQVEAQLSHGSR